MSLALHGADWPIKPVMRRVMAGFSLRSEIGELLEAESFSLLTKSHPNFD